MASRRTTTGSTTGAAAPDTRRSDQRPTVVEFRPRTDSPLLAVARKASNWRIDLGEPLQLGHRHAADVHQPDLAGRAEVDRGGGALPDAVDRDHLAEAVLVVRDPVAHREIEHGAGSHRAP